MNSGGRNLDPEVIAQATLLQKMKNQQMNPAVMMQAFMSMMGGADGSSNGSLQMGNEQQVATNRSYFPPTLADQGLTVSSAAPSTRLGTGGNLPVPVLGSSGTPLGVGQTTTAPGPPGMSRNPPVQGNLPYPSHSAGPYPSYSNTSHGPNSGYNTGQGHAVSSSMYGMAAGGPAAHSSSQPTSSVYGVAGGYNTSSGQGSQGYFTGASGGGGYFTGPVSYTHLTLPTNREV